jgi:hypothetical protein
MGTFGFTLTPIRKGDGVEALSLGDAEGVGSTLSLAVGVGSGVGVAPPWESDEPFGVALGEARRPSP